MRLLKLIPHALIPFVLLILSACNSSANTEVAISDAWVRENTPGQEVGAAYMTFISPTKSTLVSTEAIDAAGSVEIHSMSMNNGVMKMRMLEELPLEPNKPVSLKPGSFHLMLFDLKQPLKAGDNVTFKLHFKDKDGKITEQIITVPVKSAQ
jgi:periplasmic copper chaperone A